MHFIFFFFAVLLTILLIVGIHEFGHFITARLLSIRVLRFSLGFGKILFSWRDRSGTQYALSAIPLGGYVKLLDEQDDEGAALCATDLAHAFNRQPFWKKALVIIAGPIFNLLFALLLYWFIFLWGFTTLLPVTGNISAHSIAANAGVKSAEVITQIDHIAVSSWMGVLMRILDHTGEQDQLTLETHPLNNTTPKHYTLDLRHWQLDSLKPDPLASLGITPYVTKDLLHHVQFGPAAAFAHAWQNTRDFTRLNLMLTAKLFTGKLSLKSLGGPLTVFSTADAALHQGILAFMSFLAFLSISIGIINIIPIPGLDGGQLLFQIAEAVIRRPLPPRIIEMAYRLGILLIIAISIQAIINDILRL